MIEIKNQLRKRSSFFQFIKNGNPKSILVFVSKEKAGE
jgi:hypothetical protein